MDRSVFVKVREPRAASISASRSAKLAKLGEEVLGERGTLNTSDFRFFLLFAYLPFLAE